MNQALYRKYRSRSFGEVVGQEHITNTLSRAIKSGRISHAYLFTGPRGVGKTSVARILAHEVNGFKYGGETAHLDIIEIDAASNRRIDEIRDLRERVQTAPAVGKYKVYIIDEVHMLTREAFNALLKTLEEPPSHIIFVLATTESHKLPETIISRTQRFEFKPISNDKVAARLKDIAAKENINISDGALTMLAEIGRGSFRDSIGYLDQLAAVGSGIDEKDVRNILGLPSENEVDEMLKGLYTASHKTIVNSLDAIKSSGIGAAAAAAAISGRLRQQIIKGGAPENIYKLLKDLLDVPASAQPYDYLEVALLQAASANDATMKPKHTEPAAAAAPVRSAALSTAGRQSVKATPAFSATKAQLRKTPTDNWEEIVSAAKQRAASVYTALRLAEPSVENGVLVLKFQFPLHQKKLNSSKNKDLISQLILDMTGKNLRIECIVDKSSSKKISEPASHMEPVSPIKSINNIFGVAEVLD